jgi:Uma2 family endonuclease
VKAVTPRLHPAVDAELNLHVHRALAVDAGRDYVAGMSERALMTAEELLRLRLPDKRTELIRGRLVVRDPGGARHGAVAMRLGYRIMVHAEAHNLGRVYAAETGFKIESDPDTVRAPDVAFISRSRLPEVEPRGYPGWAPDLAVEVLAHDDHPAETLEKVAQWLKAGVRLVWVVDSEKQPARVYRADGSESLLGPNDALHGGDVLPGFRCPLADLW